MLNTQTIIKNLEHHAPTILTIGGVAGFAGSVLTAIIATPKAVEGLVTLDVIEKEPKAKLWEQTKLLFPIYAPSIGLFIMSTACVIGANRVGNYRYAALSTLYFTSQQSAKVFENTVRDYLGEKNYEEVRVKSVTPTTPPPLELANTESVLCFDHFSGRYFTIESVEDIQRAANATNSELMIDMWMPLNSYYTELGIDGIPYGDQIGWSVEEGMIEIVLDATLTPKNRPVVVVSFGHNVPKHAFSGIGGY